MSKSSVIVTHDDLDGVTCAILFKAVYGDDGEYYLENYDTVNERIIRIITEAKPDVLFICDISPSRDVAEILNQYDIKLRSLGDGFVQLLDHHKTAQWLSCYSWAEISVDRCGAHLLFDFIRWNMADIGNDVNFIWQYEDLVYHANDYDLWLHESPHSTVLNQLLTALGPERFIKRFLSNPSVELTEVEKFIVEIEQEKAEKYIAEAVKNARFYQDNYLAVTIADKYVSQIGDKLSNVASIAVIVNPYQGKVSLRSKNIDVAEIARRLGGGGHPKAAGFSLPQSFFDESILRLFNSE